MIEIPTLSYTLSLKNVLFRVEPLYHYRAYLSWVSLTVNRFITIHEGYLSHFRMKKKLNNLTIFAFEN